MARPNVGERERVPRRVAGYHPLGTWFPLLGPVTIHGHGVYGALGWAYSRVSTWEVQASTTRKGRHQVSEKVPLKAIEMSIQRAPPNLAWVCLPGRTVQSPTKLIFLIKSIVVSPVIGQPLLPVS